MVKVLSRLDEICDNDILNYDTIIVDEGQFFPDLVNTISRWVNNYSVNIIVGGLDGDFQRKPIGQILDLIPMADKCIKLNSLCNICKDGTEAPFSFRLVKSRVKVQIG